MTTPKFDRRSNVDNDKIESMISQENDPEKRNVLIVLQSQTSALSSCITVLNDLSNHIENRFKEHENKLIDQEKAIDDHNTIVLKGQVTWKIISAIFSVIQASLIGVIVYTFFFLADLKSSVHDHDLIIPKLESRLDRVNDQTSNIERNVDKFGDKINEKADALDDLIQQTTAAVENNVKELDKIKKKKVIKSSK